MNDVKLARMFGGLNSNTFLIPPINALIQRYISPSKCWIDPFANASVFNPVCKATNDLNLEMPTTHHLDAVKFLGLFKSESVDGVLFDPPYSVRQVSECYHGIGKACSMEDTQASFWSQCKDVMAQILKPNGIVICCGWNSNGMGKGRGFAMLEVLMVHHGGIHNDTIVTAERKAAQSLEYCLLKK